MRRAKTVAWVASVLLIAGCETQNVSRVGEEARQDITFAARAKYPGNAQDSQRVRTVAVVDPDAKRLEIFNTTDQPIPASSVWVNGTFVSQVPSIPALGSVTVPYSSLLEAGPGVNDLKSLDRTPTRVELQTSEGLFRVQGPTRSSR